MSDSVEQAWNRVEFQLDTQEGFWLGVVLGHGASAGEALRARARAWCHRRGRALELIHHDSDDISQTLDALEGSPACVHWIVSDDAERTRSLLIALNERRDALARRLEDGLILEAGETIKRDLRVISPDLFTIRAFLVEVFAPAPPTEDLIPSPSSQARRRPTDPLAPLFEELNRFALTGDLERVNEASQRLLSEAQALVAEHPQMPAARAALLRAQSLRAKVIGSLRGDVREYRWLGEVMANAPLPEGIHPAAWGRLLFEAREEAIDIRFFDRSGWAGTLTESASGSVSRSGAHPVAPSVTRMRLHVLYPDSPVATPEAFLALPVPLQCEALARLGVPSGPLGYGGTIRDQLRRALSRRVNDEKAMRRATRILYLLKTSIHASGGSE